MNESHTVAPAATPSVRFRPMQPPSLPFVIALIAVVGVAIVIVAAWSALITIAFALAAALITLPIVNWLEHHGVPRRLGALVVVLTALLALVVVVAVSANIAVNEGAAFVAAVPPALDTLHAEYYSLNLPDWLRSTLDLSFASIGEAIGGLDVSQLLLGFVQGVLGVAGVVAGLSVVPFFMYYVLVDEPRAMSGLYRGLPAPWQVHIAKAVEIFRRDFADYFRGELLVGGVVGSAIAVGMFVIGGFVGGPLAQFALLLGLIAAVLELLPSVGPVISYVPALLLAAITSPTAVLLVSIYYLAVFTVESSVLVPSIEGKVIDFGGATVLVLVAVGFGLAGIVGGALALPCAAIARDLFVYAFRTAEAESVVAEGSAELTPAAA